MHKGGPGPMAVLVALLLSVLPAQAGGPCHTRPGGAPLPLTPLLRPAEPPLPDGPQDYRHRLQTTPLGWPLQSTWCVWVEPLEPTKSPSAESLRWHGAVTLALREWQQVIAIVVVAEPQQAQVVVWRRRPPLKRDGSGRTRASHGRAILSLHSWPTAGGPKVEPRVEVLISPGQRLEGIQATALHELGHAFGLWGHSDNPGDVMALAPGPKPILLLSQRDRATVRWLYQQPTPMRSDQSPRGSNL